MCPTRGAVFRGCFAGGEDINLLFIYFEGFNEGMIGRESEMGGSMVKRGTGQLEVGGKDMCNFREDLHEQWYYGNCGIHVGRFVVHARLDYWLMSQDCRGTFLCHKLLNWRGKNQNPLQGFTLEGLTW